MVGVTQKKLRDHDKMNDCWSSGTIHHPSSQSRKISIGVMTDSSGKKRSGATTANDHVTIPNEEKVKHVMENAIDVKNGVDGRIQTEAIAQANSPWITKRSSYRKGYAPETPLYEKQGFNIPSSSGRQNMQQGGEDVAATCSVHFFANNTSVFQSVQSNQKTYVRDTQKNKEGKDGIYDRVEELASTTSKEVLFSGKAVAKTIADKTENRSSSTLKMKLFEILGNASSAKDPQSHFIKVGRNHSTPAENLGRMGETVAKHGQNSDTIETDSENPNRNIARPVTRSLSRKRAPTKVQLKKVKDKTPSCKHKQQEKGIFSLTEGLSGRLNNDNNSGSSRSTRKGSERQISRTELHKIDCPEKDNAGKTRSLSRKRAPTKVQLKKVKDKAPSCKHKQQEKGIFSFTEGLSGILNNDNNSGSSRSTRKGSERQISRTELHKIDYPEKDNAGKTQQKVNASEVAAPVEKSSSLGMVGRFHSCLLENDKYQQKSDIQEKSPHQSPMAKSTDWVDANSPNLSGNKDQQECFAYTSTKNAMDPEVDFQSPPFRLNTPTPDSSPSPVPKSNEVDQGVCSPAPEEKEISAGDIPSSRTFGTSKQNCYGSNVPKQSPVSISRNYLSDVQETKTSPGEKSASDLEERKEDDGVAESSSEEENSESSEEGCEERMTFSPDTSTAVSPKITVKSIKRGLNYKDIRLEELSSFPPSSKETMGSDWNHELPEQTQEDELARAVTLFATALKGLKSKIKLAAGKRSSEVIMYVADILRLQLENIDAQIQTDIEKLASVSKSKRRPVETKFQEQQERLTLIHEKYKEEVNQHLQECRETLSLLEAHQRELKGTTEKQRESHLKLLQQVDEAIEMQLNDAQRRVMAINKLARGQMLQLKHAMSECLKEVSG